MTIFHALVFDLPTAENPAPLLYTVSVRLPANMDGKTPQDHPSFTAWRQAFLDILAACGDAPFQQDPYGRKLALATLMNDIDGLNDRFPLRVAGGNGRPALVIALAGHDDILLDFAGQDGEFIVREAQPFPFPPPRGPRP